MKCLYCGGEALTNMEFAHDAHCQAAPGNNDLAVGYGHVSMYPEPQQGWQCPNCKSVYAPFMPSCQRCQGPVPEKEKPTWGTIIKKAGETLVHHWSTLEKRDKDGNIIGWNCCDCPACEYLGRGFHSNKIGRKK